MHNIAAHLETDYFQKSYQQDMKIEYYFMFTSTLEASDLWLFFPGGGDCLLLIILFTDYKSNRIPHGNRQSKYVKLESLRENSDIFSLNAAV